MSSTCGRWGSRGGAGAGRLCLGVWSNKSGATGFGWLDTGQPTGLPPVLPAELGLFCDCVGGAKFRLAPPPYAHTLDWCLMHLELHQNTYEKYEI